MLGSELVYTTLENFVLRTMPWETLEWTVWQSSVKSLFIWTDIQTQIYCLRNFPPIPTAVILFLREYIWKDIHKTSNKSLFIKQMVYRIGTGKEFKQLF